MYRVCVCVCACSTLDDDQNIFFLPSHFFYSFPPTTFFFFCSFVTSSLFFPDRPNSIITLTLPHTILFSLLLCKCVLYPPHRLISRITRISRPEALFFSVSEFLSPPLSIHYITLPPPLLDTIKKGKKKNEEGEKKTTLYKYKKKIKSEKKTFFQWNTSPIFFSSLVDKYVGCRGPE